MNPFPWREAMAFGFGVLKLSAHEFWGLTPRELTAAFEGLNGPQRGAPGRAALNTMMERFPDGR
ncbi:hypothetical protein GCM10007989_26110 [Devosia pacifica]|uniref:Phage tail assembly chaperone n=1 Tax=Devosia pacifica TaxID=1335967 RepID=A0A918S7U8_9HYPH|nr:rcc01693 family protein [Devosia pacifica]GHA29311.1 hypothetical protein GCM10007989_26110 [Devosia pacifica]